MKKLKIIILLITSLLLGGCNLPYFEKKVSQLQVFSNPKTNVFLNNKNIGTTPLISNDFKTGKYQIKLATDSASWLNQINLNSGTITIVNLQLAPQDGEGATGETLELVKGKGIIVISRPEKVIVSVDGREIGTTPVSINNITPGEHRIEVFKEFYLKRAIMIQVHDGYSTLISVELAKEKAKEATNSAVSAQNSITILETPTGWLRVRSQPSLSAVEIGRINSAEKHTLIQEQAGWYKIRLPDGKEGWISAQYAKKT